MLTSATKHRIDACRDILVGKLPLPTDQVELITITLIYKFMDDLDEESVKLGGKRSFFTGELAKYRWRNLLPQTVSAAERMALFAEGIEVLGDAEKAAHLPGLFRDIFRNAFLKFRDGRTLTLFLTEINGLAYSHSEELGNAFEYILQCMGTQGENGQFRTPRHIIDFIVDCLEPQPGDRILDPACGTGGFLVSAYKHILAHHTSPGSTMPGDRLTHAQRQKVYANLTGYDITDLMVKLTKVNLFLHGFPDPAIHIYDTLSNDARWNEKADLILANPPFMTPRGGVTPHTRFRVAAKKAEVLFTDYIAEHLSADGRGGVIVPNGIVATTQTAYTKLRRFLVEDSLVAVVSLPSGVFKPYSGVKTSILFLDKKRARQTKEVLFLKITADGFDLGDQRRENDANDLPEAERIVKAWLASKLDASFETTLAWTAVEKIKLLSDTNHSLSAERFLGNVESDVTAFPLVPVGRFMKQSVKTIDPRNTPDELFELWSIPAFDAGCPELLRGGEIGSQKKVVTSRDVLLSRIIPHIRRAWVVRENPDTRRQVASTEWIVFAGEEVVPAFLRQILVSNVFHRSFMQTITGVGGSLSRANPSAVADIKIPLPPLEEQRRIVDEIEGFQKVIDGARQILAGYKPQFETDPDWSMVELRGLVSLSSGGTPSKGNPDYWIGAIPWISAKDMKTPQLSDAQLHVSDSAIKETATQLAPKGTILVLVRGMGLANGVPICELLAPCAFNQDIKALHVAKTIISAYLAAALRREEEQLKKAIGTAAHGTLKIDTDRLLAIQIPLPPLEEQRRIVAELDAEAVQMDTVRALIPRFEAKIQRVLDRVWGGGLVAERVDGVDRLDKVAETAGAAYGTGGGEVG